VTSTTVLVNGDAADEASELARVAASMNVGVHVNLTLGRPTVDPARIPSLVTADGSFHSREALIRLLLRRKVSAHDIVREAGAQIDVLHRLGIVPSHWDTHQHIAELPPIARAVGVAAKDAGILRARTPRVWVVNGGDTPFVARWRWRTSNPQRILGEAARAVSHHVIARNFATPSFRAAANLVAAPEMTHLERWNFVLSHLPAGTCEVMTHPGYVDDRVRELTPTMTTERVVDLQVATHADTRALLAEARVVPVPFALI
jgi:predicted glycoside hydrolase/deacetylase ChbG (UPF0249 family)